MNVQLSDEQRALQEAVGRHAREALEGGGRRAAFEAGDGLAGSYWRGLVELGVAGMAIDPAHGGLGLGLVDLALVAEVLGDAAAPGPFLGHVLAARALQAAGSPDQQARWLPRLAAGTVVATIALAEPGERWHPDEWTLRLDQGRLSGVKTMVPCAAQAGLVVVGIAGGGLALVETAAGGMRVTPLDGADRTRPLGVLEFDAAPAAALAGPAGLGCDLCAELNVLLAADAFGGAARVLRMTVEYARTRVQFGTMIGAFQGIKHRLANLACALEPTRGLYWYAALAQDLRQADRGRLAQLAKAHLTERYNEAARTAVELHGGLGFTWEYDLQMWVKRALFDFACAGTPARQRRWAMQALAA